VGRGHIPGAIHVPRGSLESRIENAVPDHDSRMVVYCASGARSAFATKTLEELGYADVANLEGGCTEGSERLPTELPKSPASSSGAATAAIC
jgi:rhodanese-related sulfurtransferase